MQDALVVDGNVFRYHGHELRMFDSVDSWLGALGPPSRTLQSGDVLTWDDQGLRLWVSKSASGGVVRRVDVTVLGFDDAGMSDLDRWDAIWNDGSDRPDRYADIREEMLRSSPNFPTTGERAEFVARYKDRYLSDGQPHHGFPGRVVVEGAVLKKGWNELEKTVDEMKDVPAHVEYFKHQSWISYILLLPVYLFLPHGDPSRGMAAVYPDYFVYSPDAVALQINFVRDHMEFREVQFHGYLY
ncbi:hypothetical protein LZC95_14300 [Pendulispora brunnea]|uniref:DUF7738 domain-containing protein n=1 Tax=Pendulispora brunnea TaxID=2905690 RepID=A0ABZ2KIX7_9BACT